MFLSWYFNGDTGVETLNAQCLGLRTQGYHLLSSAQKMVLKWSFVADASVQILYGHCRGLPRDRAFLSQ